MFTQADATRLPLADRSVDLVFGSPPYCDARTYGIGAQRDCMAWVEWMMTVTAEAQRVARGPVLWVAAGVTRDRNYWPACEGLMWEWWKRGGDCQLYRPCYWHRVGIPGSGGKDWFRADVEFVMCFKRPGALPWSDNTAMGHPPKWGPGGEMSNRVSNGARVNQWGHSIASGATTVAKDGSVRSRGQRPSHVEYINGKPMYRRGKDGERQLTKRNADGDMVSQSYHVPTKANPGNLIRTNVGGGQMGHPLAHENEAPFPEALAEWFIRSLCPPGGIVLDPFSGSGTTVAVAHRLDRHGIGMDLRMSQCELGRRRLLNPHHRRTRPAKPRVGQHELFAATSGR
jgi:hypothetical protein